MWTNWHARIAEGMTEVGQALPPVCPKAPVAHASWCNGQVRPDHPLRGGYRCPCGLYQMSEFEAMSGRFGTRGGRV